MNDSLKFVLNSDAVKAMANHVSSINGNMRCMVSLAIEALRFFCIKGRPESMIEIIRHIKSQQITANIISNLGTTCLIILFAAWNFSEKFDCKKFSFDSVFFTVTKIAENEIATVCRKNGFNNEQ